MSYNANEPTEPTDPPADPVAVIDPAPAADDPSPELVDQPEPAAKPAKKADPIIAELTQQRARRREAEERASKAEREAADAKALLERMAKAKDGDNPAPAHNRDIPPDDAEIDRRADYKLFLRDVSSVRERGGAEFGPDGFGGVIQSLAAYGADSDAFVRAVMDVDRENAHKLLHEIAQDGARAIGLVNMTPTQRIAELTRMSIARQTKPAEPTPKPAVAAPDRAISQAPRPAPKISPSASTEAPRWSDKRSEKEFDQDFKEWAKRHTRK